MRILNKKGIELIENEIDLSAGYLTTGFAIKVDAVPIDNITKFAWDNEDYEEVQYYCEYSEIDRQSNMPTTEDRIAALEAALLELMGVAIDG